MLIILIWLIKVRFQAVQYFKSSIIVFVAHDFEPAQPLCCREFFYSLKRYFNAFLPAFFRVRLGRKSFYNRIRYQWQWPLL